MPTSNHHLNPSEAARKLGVSTKTLRIYEARGLISPARTETGWRTYGPDEMARAAEIATLRRLGLSLAQIARVLDGNAEELDSALAAHGVTLDRQMHDLTCTMKRVRQLRAELIAGTGAVADGFLRLVEPAHQSRIAFDLPWPWGGERFELTDIRPIMYITGPLGSGKTRFARCLSEALPAAKFLDLARQDDGQMEDGHNTDNPVREARVNTALAWIADEGGTATDALRVLVSALEIERPGSLIVDMIEQGLDTATQSSVMAYLRHRTTQAHPLFVMTRSSAILDLDLVGHDEGIIYCPANHSPPLRVAPFEGTHGYEAVATCVAPPDVRARTEGVIAWRPERSFTQPG